MKTLSVLSLAVALLGPVWCVPLIGMNAHDFESGTNLQGVFSQSEQVFRSSFPRTDIKVYVGEEAVDPFMGLGSWAAFRQMNNNQFMVMGDWCLFQDEVNPVMSSLLDAGVDITALHNHLFFDTPRVFFMHIEGKGSLNALGMAIKKALQTIHDIRAATPIPATSFGDPPPPSTNTITQKTVDDLLNVTSQAKDGRVKVIIGRTASMGGCELGQEMGLQSYATFSGTDTDTVVNGDLAVHADEIPMVLRALRAGGINIVAIHNHMTTESPRTFFIHFWGRGPTKALAQTLKQTLGYMPISVKESHFDGT